MSELNYVREVRPNPGNEKGACCEICGALLVFLSCGNHGDERVAELTAERDHFESAWATELRKRHEYMSALTGCQDKVAELEAALERMKQPVSDQEWKLWSHEVVIPSKDFDPDERFHMLNRRNCDNLLAARTKEP